MVFVQARGRIGVDLTGLAPTSEVMFCALCLNSDLRHIDPS
jgi:hypothetical protein